MKLLLTNHVMLTMQHIRNYCNATFHYNIVIVIVPIYFSPWRNQISNFFKEHLQNKDKPIFS